MKSESPDHATDDLSTAWLLDGHGLSPSNVPLTVTAMERAIAWSQAIPQVDQQWQVYLHGLAIAGLEQWLAERAPDLAVDLASLSLQQPAWASLVASGCQVQVAGQPLTVIAVSPAATETVPCPRAIFEVPALAAAAYLFVQVWEEAEEAQILGFFTDAAWQHQQATNPLAPTADWQYEVPLTWLNPAVDQLLWAWRSQTLASPIPRPRTLPAAPAIATLRNRLARWATVGVESTLLTPWLGLSWAEGQLLLQSPDLVRQFYDLQWEARTGIPRLADIDPTPAPALGDRLRQQSINVAHWFHDRLDELAQELAWVLLPALAVAPAMRSSGLRGGLDTVVTTLQQQGVEIPPTARGAYQDLRWSGIEVRLYLLTWPLPTDLGTPSEWVLLVIAGAQNEAALPAGLRLIVRDQIQTLEERIVDRSTGDQYLYAQVVGTNDEQFWITVDLTRGAVVTLPPLHYDPAIAA